MSLGKLHDLSALLDHCIRLEKVDVKQIFIIIDTLKFFIISQINKVESLFPAVLVSKSINGRNVSSKISRDVVDLRQKSKGKEREIERERERVVSSSVLTSSFTSIKSVFMAALKSLRKEDIRNTFKLPVSFEEKGNMERCLHIPSEF